MEINLEPASPLLKPEPQKPKQRQQEKYTLIEELGRGSFGAVYLAEAHTSQQKYAVKQIDVTNMDIYQKRDAKLEACIMQKFNHPNIIKCHDIYTTKTKLCFVMEYVDSGTLESLIKEKHDLVQKGDKTAYFLEAEIYEIFCQIVLALKEVHAENILHRDVKTQNIMLTSQKQCKLGDFGVSTLLLNSKDKATSQTGTPFYLSPEIISGKSYRYESDIWTLGVILYELTALKYPFYSKQLADLYKQISKKIVDTNALSFNYSSDLKNMIKSLLKKDPTRRPTLNQLMSHPKLRMAFERLQQKYPSIQEYYSNQTLQQNDFVSQQRRNTVQMTQIPKLTKLKPHDRSNTLQIPTNNKLDDASNSDCDSDAGHKIKKTKVVFKINPMYLPKDKFIIHLNKIHNEPELALMYNMIEENDEMLLEIDNHNHYKTLIEERGIKVLCEDCDKLIDDMVAHILGMKMQI